MKKKLMPLAVGAAVTASVAQAQMYVNNDGVGEMLIFPFYSAESGNSTNVNITNTYDQAKAVKIRIIEGENSQEVLDFNVYMSAHDHFSFAILATEDGGGSLVTNDNTCTVPRLTPGEAVPFRNFLYLPDKGDDDPATEDKDESFDNTGIERTATGYIEVIEMGQLFAVDPTNPTGSPYYDAEKNPSGANPIVAVITHGADGFPADCDVPVAAWSTGGDWATETGGSADAIAGSYFEPYWVGGGLYGEASIVNVSDAVAFGTDAVAIESAVVGLGWQLHYPPGSTKPDFTSPGIVPASVIEVLGAVGVVDYSSESGVSGTGGNGSLLAVSALFQTEEIMNDYVTDPGIGALTDFIITQPTKFQHINQVPELVPYSNPWNGQNACEYATIYNWDREEANPAPTVDVPDFSPAPETPLDLYDLPLCYEVNVVAFGPDGASAVKNESLAVGVDELLEDNDGWAIINFSYDALTDDGKDTVDAHERWMCDDFDFCLSGLPVTGFAAQTYTNGNVNGSGNVANYGAAFLHKTAAACSGDTQLCALDE